MKGLAAARDAGGLLGHGQAPKSRTQLWAALNRDQALLAEVRALVATLDFKSPSVGS
jgi:hypothetical protein